MEITTALTAARRSVRASLVETNQSSDGSKVKMFDDLLQDPAYRALVDRFVEELPQRVLGISQANEQADHQTLVRLAHQLNGAGGGFGFGRVSILAAKVEKLAQASASAELLVEAIDHLRDETTRVADEWNTPGLLQPAAEAHDPSESSGTPMRSLPT